MGLVFQLLMIVTLLICDVQQLGRKGNSATYVLGYGFYDVVNGFNTGMGPYDIDVKLLKQCDDRGINLIDLNMEAYNTKTVNGSKILYRGNFTTPFTPEQIDSLRVRIRAIRMKDMKEFVLVDYEENLCLTAIGPGLAVFIAVKNKLGIKNLDPCNIPQGFYSFNNWEVKIDVPPPVLEYGDYRGVTEIFHQNQKFVCLDMLAVIKQRHLS